MMCEVGEERRAERLLQKPGEIRSIWEVKQLHAQIVRRRSSRSLPSVKAVILSLYSTFRQVELCEKLFKTLLPSPPALAWKSVIRCYASNGMFDCCFSSLRRMMAVSGKLPDHNVFPSVLKSCASLPPSYRLVGLSVHSLAFRLGLLSDLFTANALLNFYSKQPPLSLHGTERRRCSGSVGILHPTPAGTAGGYLGEEGDGGPACDIRSVKKVFEMMVARDVVSWNTVIAGNAEEGMAEEALIMVREMCQAGLNPDSFTLSTVLPIFAESFDVSKGREVHAYAVRHGSHTDVFVGSSLIDMYANCNAAVTYSLRVFHSLPSHDRVSWNSVVAGCVQNGLFDEGLRLFRRMLISGIAPSPISLATVIPACSHLTALRLGTQLHAHSVRRLFNHNKFVSTSLVDMYAKCGNVAAARRIFDGAGGPDMVGWTAMMMGYASHGHGHAAVSLFVEMLGRGMRPGYVLFVALLTACSHGGLLDEGMMLFGSMSRDYGVTPGVEHHAAMADLLSRVGRLDEAYTFISGMPFGGTGGIWSALLAACRHHRNAELAEKVLEKVVEVEPGNTGAHILLSSVYADAGRWRDSEKMRVVVKEKDMERTPSCSWIEVGEKAHVFMAGDNSRSHMDYDRLRDVLLPLVQHMVHHVRHKWK